MNGILFGAWLFWMVAFCAVGIGCRVACRGRLASGRACICGRHEASGRVSAAVAVPSSGTQGPASRFRVAERHVRALQQRYLEGRLSMEQYETELDRVVGRA
jgi:hypothetical protein